MTKQSRTQTHCFGRRDVAFFKRIYVSTDGVRRRMLRPNLIDPVVIFHSVSAFPTSSNVSPRLRRLRLTYASNRRCLRVGVLISSGPWSQARSNVIGIVDAACETSSSQLIIVRHGVPKRSDNSNRLFHLAWYNRGSGSERASERSSDENNRWRWESRDGREGGTASGNSEGILMKHPEIMRRYFAASRTMFRDEKLRTKVKEEASFLQFPPYVINMPRCF